MSSVFAPLSPSSLPISPATTAAFFLLSPDWCDASVESARFLDPATEQRVRESLTSQYGQGLNFEFRTNPDLMGGMKIQVGDDVIDGSMQARLARLATAF